MMMNLSDEELILILDRRLRERQKQRLENEALRSEIVSLASRLCHSEKLKTNFLSNIRNEINNPVASILGLCRMMSAHGQCDEEQVRKNAALIYHEVFNLEFQLRNIIVAAEIEAGEVNVSPAIVPVERLVTEAIDAVEHKCQARNVKVSLSSGHDKLPFHSDGELLYLIIINLISNAVEFAPEKTAVVVEHWESNHQLTISVKDSGPGIPKEDQESVFDRFRQLDEGSCKKHGGHGLGLSIARELALVLGGTLELESEPGEGAIFRLMIPSMNNDQGCAVMEEWNEILFSNDGVL